jgi:hypothetical protein
VPKGNKTIKNTKINKNRQFAQNSCCAVLWSVDSSVRFVCETSTKTKNKREKKDVAENFTTSRLLRFFTFTIRNYLMNRSNLKTGNVETLIIGESRQRQSTAYNFNVPIVQQWKWFCCCDDRAVISLTSTLLTGRIYVMGSPCELAKLLAELEDVDFTLLRTSQHKLLNRYHIRPMTVEGVRLVVNSILESSRKPPN